MRIIPYLRKLGLINLLPDSIVLKKSYRRVFNRKLDLKNPIRYTEKNQWLKIHDRNPKYTMMVDKYLVKEYIAKTIGEEYVIPLLGVWNSFDEIDFEKLPEQFVLKTNHDWNGIYIFKDKNQNKLSIRDNINDRLKHNYFWAHDFREWVYKDIKPVVFAEKYMDEGTGESLRDYKFMCFNGKVRMIQVESNRVLENNSVYMNYYDTNWEPIQIERLDHEMNPKHQNKPLNFEKMIEIAETLSKDISFVRVDLYEVLGKIYFGELTFYHTGGFLPFKNDSDDLMLGSWLDLPDKKSLKMKNAALRKKLSKLQQ